MLGLFVAGLLAEGWFIYALRVRVGAAEKEVQQRIDEIERLQRGRPAPTLENVNAVREEFAQNADVLATMLRVLNVAGPDELPFFQGAPTVGTAAYFEISRFVDRMNSEAQKYGVELRPGERFGFAAYAETPPDPPYLQSVYRQHRIVEYLLQRLFAAGPRSLVGVQREQPAAVPVEGSAAPSPAAAPPTAGPRAGDRSAGEIFVIDPQVSARTPGYVDTLAFRVIFSGHTSALRGFLNALAAPDIPLVVRSVEVSPSAPEAGRRLASGARAGPQLPPAATGEGSGGPLLPGIVPIVVDNVFVFTVTVELFEVRIRAPAVAASGRDVP